MTSWLPPVKSEVGPETGVDPFGAEVCAVPPILESFYLLNIIIMG